MKKLVGFIILFRRCVCFRTISGIEKIRGGGLVLLFLFFLRVLAHKHKHVEKTRADRANHNAYPTPKGTCGQNRRQTNRGKNGEENSQILINLKSTFMVAKM